MELYKVSERFEINYIGEKAIIFSNDFLNVYQAGLIESMILKSFSTPSRISLVKEKMRAIPQFNEHEFESFINDLIIKEILVAHEE